MRLGLAALLCCVALPAAAQDASVAGRVTLAVEGVRLADLGQTVVYLAAEGAPAPAPAKRATIRQRNAYFAPDFLAIAVGQSVDMPNDDAIFHNVFSFSKPNDFDLGLYPAGESRHVTFEHAGVVKIYCSIHETMSGTIFVSPSPCVPTNVRSAVKSGCGRGNAASLSSSAFALAGSPDFASA